MLHNSVGIKNNNFEQFQVQTINLLLIKAKIVCIQLLQKEATLGIYYQKKVKTLDVEYKQKMFAPN